MMTVGRLRARMRRMREEAEESADEGGELNLVPYLDIVSNIVMFLLATITFTASLGNVNVAAPSYATGDSQSASEAERPPLNLTLQVSEKGFTIAGSGSVMKNPQTGNVPTIPKVADQYSYGALTQLVANIKTQWRSETRVIFVANPDVPYDVVIKTLDAVRQDAGGRLLFPDVVFSPGVAGLL
jgi:biopolymer transport protein ExbD